MNYIQLIRKFWTSNELNSFRTSEIALFFYLAEINNRLSWSESFKRNNQRVMFDLSISFNTLKDARNRLKQAGLIDFQTQNGSPNVIYKILTLSNFDEVTDEVTDEVSTRLLSRSLTSKNKQETKQNKNSSSSNNINTTQSTVTAAAAFDFEIEKIFSFWNDNCKNLPPVLQRTEARAAAVRGALQRYTADEICACLLAASQSPTLNGTRNQRPIKIDWCLAHIDSLREDVATAAPDKTAAVKLYTGGQVYQLTGCFPSPDYCAVQTPDGEMYALLSDAEAANLTILRRYDQN